MASRDGGATVSGTDGSDHIHRETVASQYQVSSRMKSYLSYNLYFHILITLFFLAKLSPAILDRMDIFILPLEELNIPKPMLWEWIWVGGSLLIFAIGSNAIKASKVNKITIFMGVVNAIGIIPVFYCFAVHYTDAVAYYFEPHNKIYQTWMGYPVAILWYIFGFVAMNIHFGEIYFAYVLKDAWSIKKKTN